MSQADSADTTTLAGAQTGAPLAGVPEPKSTRKSRARTGTAVAAPQEGHGSNVVDLVAMIERLARDKSVDIDRLDRMLAVWEKQKAVAAEQAFNAAMSAAQAAMGPIRADSRNDQTRSQYASYAALDGAVRPIYTAHGFSLTFNTEDAPDPEKVRIVCFLSHTDENGGFMRRYHLDMPVDGKGAKGADVMTKTHAMGSGISYGMRYLLRMIFNLPVCQDDDGNGAGRRPSFPSQQRPALPQRPQTVAPSPRRRLMEDLRHSAAMSVADRVPCDPVPRERLEREFHPHPEHAAAPGPRRGPAGDIPRHSEREMADRDAAEIAAKGWPRMQPVRPAAPVFNDRPRPDQAQPRPRFGPDGIPDPPPQDDLEIPAYLDRRRPR